MTARQLYENGHVRDAASALAAYLRDHPTDVQSRTFLFELLCFSGEYDRAQKHLGILAGGSRESEMGAVLYFSALHAEKLRHDLFRKQEYPSTEPPSSPPGTLNGKPFLTLRDADPQIGARFELYAAGAYLWVPFQNVASLKFEPVRHLRDCLWRPGSIVTGPGFRDDDIREVLVPGIYPFSWKSQDESVWLGRTMAWVADDEGNEFPVGHKSFLVDGEEVPMAEIQSIEFAHAANAAA